MEEIPYIVAQECKEYKKNKPCVKSKNYIIGKFENSKKKYTWKLTKNIPVKVGDRVLVESKTRNGMNRTVVTVVDIISSNNPQMFKHKPVIKILSKEDK